jgi:hypothetical protein
MVSVTKKLRYYCIVHDNEVVTDMPVFVPEPLDTDPYTPTYCRGEIYDKEGPTCVFQWEYPHRRVIFTATTSPFARKIKGTKLYSRTFADIP